MNRHVGILSRLGDLLINGLEDVVQLAGIRGGLVVAAVLGAVTEIDAPKLSPQMLTARGCGIRVVAGDAVHVLVQVARGVAGVGTADDADRVDGRAGVLQALRLVHRGGGDDGVKPSAVVRLAVGEEDDDLLRVGARLILQRLLGAVEGVVGGGRAGRTQALNRVRQAGDFIRQVADNLRVVVTLPIGIIADLRRLFPGELHQGDAVPLAPVANRRVLVGRRIDEAVDRGLERVDLLGAAAQVVGHRTGHIQHQHDVEWLVRHDLARICALRTGDVQRHLVRAVSIGGNGLLAGRSRQRRIIRHAVCSLGGKRSRRAGGRLLIGGLRLCRGGIPIVRHGGRAHAGDAAKHRYGGHDGH